MGFECDGYQKPKPAPAEPRGLARRDLRNLIPKALSMSPERTLSTYHFESQQEYLSFQTFHERSMFELVDTGSSDLWDRILMQACEFQGSIRNAVVAIGALSCTLDTSQAEEEQQQLERVQNNVERHQFALQKYGYAISRMRRDIEKGQYDLRTTLICCILVVCFELFEGNHNSALIHATSGLALIKERKNSHERECTAGKLENFEESLGEIFVRLDRTARPFALESLFEVQDNIKDGMEYTSSEVFTSYTEAREAWNWTVNSISQSTGLSDSRASNVGQRIRARAASQNLSTGIGEYRDDEVDLVFARVCHDQFHLQHELDRLLKWYTSFQPLFRYSRTSEDAHFRAKTAYLQARHHISFIALTCAQWDDELQYDSFTPLFQETVELSRDVLIEQKTPTWNRPVFTFNTGVIGFLWVVATKCRDSATRWRAVQVMLEFPSREGRWHSAFVAKGAEAIIGLEEVGVQDMIIPEEARVRVEGVTYELVPRKGKLTYSRPPRLGEFGLSERIHEKIDILW